MSNFNYSVTGQEDINEINAIEFEARIYEPRIGKWKSIDPSFRKFPDVTPYSYCLNNTLLYFDPDGKNPFIIIPFIIGFVMAPEVGRTPTGNAERDNEQVQKAEQEKWEFLWTVATIGSQGSRLLSLGRKLANWASTNPAQAAEGAADLIEIFLDIMETQRDKIIEAQTDLEYEKLLKKHNLSPTNESETESFP